MQRIAVISILLIFCLIGCGANPSSLISIEPNSSSGTEKKESIELLNYVSATLHDMEYTPTAVSVTDTNGDHLPEIILEQGDGWNYHVYYCADGSVHEVGDLSAWVWSSDLLKSPEGDLVLRTNAHTTGTAGQLQYRLYLWDGTRYTLEADLCRTVDQWDDSDIHNPVPASFFYY